MAPKKPYTGDIGPSSFDDLTDEEKETHFAIRRYGDFVLTGAVSPSYDVMVRPERGYRHDDCDDPVLGTDVPTLQISETRSRLLDLFDSLIGLFGEYSTVTLLSSHDSRDVRRFERGHMEKLILRSIMQESQIADQLLNDGCTGIMVRDTASLAYVLWDEHKILSASAKMRADLASFEDVVATHGLPRNEQLRLISDRGVEHVHHSSDEYRESFRVLLTQFGADHYDR